MSACPLCCSHFLQAKVVSVPLVLSDLCNTLQQLIQQPAPQELLPPSPSLQRLQHQQKQHQVQVQGSAEPAMHAIPASGSPVSSLATAAAAGITADTLAGVGASPIHGPSPSTVHLHSSRAQSHVKPAGSPRQTTAGCKRALQLAEQRQTFKQLKVETVAGGACAMAAPEVLSAAAVAARQAADDATAGNMDRGGAAEKEARTAAAAHPPPLAATGMNAQTPLSTSISTSSTTWTASSAFSSCKGTRGWRAWL